MQPDLDRLRRVTASLPGVVFGLARSPDGELAVRFVGDGARELFEVDPERLMASFEYIREAVHPDDLDSLEQSLHESARDLSRWDWSGRAFSADGNLKHVRAVADPVRESDGTVSWDGALLDQTDAMWGQTLEAAMRRRLQLIVEHLPASS